jgi:hypothetical protein
VAKRIKTFDRLQMRQYEVDTVNIEAVKRAYIDGSLEIRPGCWTYWVSGKQKSGYVKSPIAMAVYHMKSFYSGLKRIMDIVCGWSGFGHVRSCPHYCNPVDEIS